MNRNTTLSEGDFKSLRDAMEKVARYFPENHIFAELDENRKLVYYTGRWCFDEINRLGEGLIRNGLKNKHIAIVAENSVRYIIADLAVNSGVGIIVPLDVNASEELLAALVDKADIDAAFCSSFCVEKVRKAGVPVIITMDRRVDGVPYWEDITASGNVPDAENSYRHCELDVNAPAKILFTSGTTGVNKGVVLTNANLTANILNCMSVIKAFEGNTSMSVLPMHHATEIYTHIMIRVVAGRLTYINGNMKSMMANMKIFKPDVITIVPMILNAFYRNIWSGARKSGKEEKLRKGIRLSNLLRKVGIDRTHQMFADLFEPFGGNLCMIVCGGSMLNPVVIKGMNDLGVRVENGYGITECGPLISINSDTLKEHLSVGKPCPGLEVRIQNPDENGIGELCVRGASVARGYYKDEEATREAFMQDGFFNTGDSAYVDCSGKIFLVGRKKNTIVLENGKNVCPEEIENVIETHIGYADDIVVYQAEYHSGAVSGMVLCAGLFIKDEAVRADTARIIRDITKVNSTLNSFKRIEYVELPSVEYPKTSSRKIKRQNLPSVCSEQGLKIQ